MTMKYKYTPEEFLESEYNRALIELQGVPENTKDFTFRSGKVIALKKTLERYRRLKDDGRLLL